MTTKIERIGEDVLLRSPLSVVEQARLSEGALADVSVERGAIVIRSEGHPKYILEELLAQITPENLHGEL